MTDQTDGHRTRSATVRAGSLNERTSAGAAPRPEPVGRLDPEIDDDDRFESEVRSGDPRPSGPYGDATARIVRVAVIGITFVVVAALVAAVWSSGRDKVYGADAEVRYQVGEEATFNGAARALQSQTSVIRSRSVLDSAADAVGVDREDLERDVDVEVLPDTEVIRIAMTAASPAEAERVLTAVLDAYLPVAVAVADRSTEFLDDEVTAIDARLSEVDELLVDAVALSVDAPADSTPALVVRRLETERELLLDERGRLISIRAEIELTELPETRIDILSDVHADTDPVAPDPVRAAVVAAIAAMIVAGSAAVLYLRNADTHPHLGN